MKLPVWDTRQKYCEGRGRGDSFLVPSWTVLPTSCAACSLSGPVSTHPILPQSHQLCMLWEGDDCVLKERAVSTSSAVRNIPNGWWKKSRSCKTERKLLEDTERGQAARGVGGHPTHTEVAQSCPTLCDPMDCSPPGSSVHGIFQAWILEWVAVSFSKKCSNYRTIALISYASRVMLVCGILERFWSLA